MSHDHHHPISNYNRAFAIGVSLNIIYVVIETSYGLIADSLALIADAGHNLSDVIGLLLAWGATWLATRHSTEKKTFGLRRATILASLASALLLLVALGGIAWEAVQRFSNPQPVEGTIIIVVAAIGVVINAATAMLFVSGQKHDLNIKGAYLHMAADAAVSLGVVIAGVVIMVSGGVWVDPAISLGIVVIILFSTWHLFRDSLNLSLDGTPGNIDTQAIKTYLHNLEDVSAMHDFHVWALSTTETALTVHIITRQAQVSNGFLKEILQYLHDKHGIEHATIQIENQETGAHCPLNRPVCV